MVGVVALALGVSLIVSAAAASGHAGSRSTVARLSPQGALRLNLELLLRQTFGDRQPSSQEVGRDEIDFSCAGSCSPLSIYSPYLYEFQAETAKSTFRLLRARGGQPNLGNYPAPILIRDHLVGCGRGRYLAEYTDTVGWALACLAIAVRTPVLGRKAVALSGGRGWGTFEPREIYNGGDPSGLVVGIHWHRWGQRFALGFGRNAIFKPTGGYYARMVTIELRPSALGHCVKGGPLAYRRMVAREPLKPGGPFGPWVAWGATPSICAAP